MKLPDQQSMEDQFMKEMREGQARSCHICMQHAASQILAAVALPSAIWKVTPLHPHLCSSVESTLIPLLGEVAVPCTACVNMK